MVDGQEVFERHADGMASQFAFSDPRHVPDNVQKFCLIGEHTFTYASLYELARTFCTHPGLLSEAQTYAELY